MFVVGLTGGIGSGKTAATDYLAGRGIAVVDADLASRRVVEPGQPALDAIVDRVEMRSTLALLIDYGTTTWSGYGPFGREAEGADGGMDEAGVPGESLQPMPPPEGRPLGRGRGKPRAQRSSS